MNSYQKATLLMSLAALPLALLFMDGMNYRGIGAAAAAWVLATSSLVYALRKPAEQRQC